MANMMMNNDPVNGCCCYCGGARLFYYCLLFASIIVAAQPSNDLFVRAADDGERGGGGAKGGSDNDANSIMPPCWQDGVDVEAYLKIDDDTTNSFSVRKASHSTNSAASLSGITCNASSTASTTSMAGEYPCKNTNLLSMIPASVFGTTLNDVWGWTDHYYNREYALVGLSNGTAFVDITNGLEPVYLAYLPKHDTTSEGGGIWRDVKTYKNYAYIVSEIPGDGMQIFYLRHLRTIRRSSPNLPIVANETAHYDGFSRAHNLFINEDTGRAFAVGSDTCGGGLHIVNIQNPIDPTYAGCHDENGYTHDVQCVTYEGPHTEYVGNEICFASNQNKLDIIDTTNAGSSTRFLSSVQSEEDFRYTHQGWLTEDHRYFLLCDELDESSTGKNTTTFILDVSDLEAPRLIGKYQHASNAVDHNLFIKGNYVYLANYKAGLRVLDIAKNLTAATDGQQMLTEVAYFDFMPGDDGVGFDGAWGAYPFYESGKVVISGVHQGLLVLHPTSTAVPTPALCTACLAVMSGTQAQFSRVACRDTCKIGAFAFKSVVDRWGRVSRTCGKMCKWTKRTEDPLTTAQACSAAANCG